jgi:hypothetical protein
VVKPRHIFAFLALALSTPAQTQTGRDYFNELKAANAFNHYRDEYVCFRDDDTPTFAVIAKVGDIIKDMEKANDAASVKTMALLKNDLFVKTYYKGVGSEDYIYEAANESQTDDNREYFIEFKGPSPGKMVYSINWTTGRYLLRVYMFQKSRVVPSADGAGKCELIHPSPPQ